METFTSLILTIIALFLYGGFSEVEGLKCFTCKYNHSSGKQVYPLDLDSKHDCKCNKKPSMSRGCTTLSLRRRRSAELPQADDEKIVHGVIVKQMGAGSAGRPRQYVKVCGEARYVDDFNHEYSLRFMMTGTGPNSNPSGVNTQNCYGTGEMAVEGITSNTEFKFSKLCVCYADFCNDQQNKMGGGLVPRPTALSFIAFALIAIMALVTAP